MFKACIGFRSRRVEYLDKTHCNLARIPEEVYRNERWLEELIMDMNMIQEFPPVSSIVQHIALTQKVCHDVPRDVIVSVNTIVTSVWFIVEILSAGEFEATQR